ncbi:hypothetical protein HK104_010229 [Borealophlyctis nickersoniae]|nr:hypothetical protein HK104_010229 [Borealophlyctis nickersoniae]
MPGNMDNTQLLEKTFWAAISHKEVAVGQMRLNRMDQATDDRVDVESLGAFRHGLVTQLQDGFSNSLVGQRVKDGMTEDTFDHYTSLVISFGKQTFEDVLKHLTGTVAMLNKKAFENDNYYESLAYCFTKDEDDNEESSVFKEMHSISESVVAAVKDFMDSVDACIESDEVPVNSEVPERLSSLKAHLLETKTLIDGCHGSCREIKDMVI